MKPGSGHFCQMCCWHLFHGALWSVLPDGCIVQKCCKCSNTRTIHKDHATHMTHSSKVGN